MFLLTPQMPHPVRRVSQNVYTLTHVCVCVAHCTLLGCLVGVRVIVCKSGLKGLLFTWMYGRRSWVYVKDHLKCSYELYVCVRILKVPL